MTDEIVKKTGTFCIRERNDYNGGCDCSRCNFLRDRHMKQMRRELGLK